MRLRLTAAVLLASAGYGQNNCDRSCLEDFVDQYLDAVVAHDSSHFPLAKGAKYTENCQHQELNDGRIRDRRFVAVDQERGLFFSFAFFDHAAGKTRTFQTPDGRTVTAGPVRPWTWELAEMFKIEKGKIRRIEAILEQVPYGMGSGWSSWEDQMSSRAR